MIEYAVLFILVALVASVLWLNSKIDKQFAAIWNRFNAVQSKILRLELKTASPADVIHVLPGTHTLNTLENLPFGITIKGAVGDGIADDTEAVKKHLGL